MILGCRDYFHLAAGSRQQVILPGINIKLKGDAKFVEYIQKELTVFQPIEMKAVKLNFCQMKAVKLNFCRISDLLIIDVMQFLNAQECKC